MRAFVAPLGWLSDGGQIVKAATPFKARSTYDERHVFGKIFSVLCHLPFDARFIIEYPRCSTLVVVSVVSHVVSPTVIGQ